MSRSNARTAPAPAYAPEPLPLSAGGGAAADDHNRDRWTDQCNDTFRWCLRFQTWFCMPVFLIQAVVVFCLGVIHTADADVSIFTKGVQHGTRVAPVYAVSWAFFGSFVSGFLLCVYPTVYEHQLRLHHASWRYATEVWSHSWLMLLVGLLTGTTDVATLLAVTGLLAFMTFATALDDDQRWWTALCGQLSVWVVYGVSFLTDYYDLSRSQRGLFGVAASLQLLLVLGPALYMYRCACSTPKSSSDDLRFLRGELLSLVGSAVFQTIVAWQIVSLLWV
jgi:hypothetical protein